MKFDADKFSYRLLSLMEEYNLTQKKLAELVGTTNVTISRYISGDREPRLEIATRLANVFNVSIDYLLGNTENKEIDLENGNLYFDLSNTLIKLYKLAPNVKLTHEQIESAKKLLLAGKDLIIPNKSDKKKNA